MAVLRSTVIITVARQAVRKDLRLLNTILTSSTEYMLAHQVIGIPT